MARPAHSVHLADGRTLQWSDPLDYYAYIYRRGVLTHSEFEALGGDLARVPTLEDLMLRAVEVGPA